MIQYFDRFNINGVISRVMSVYWINIMYVTILLSAKMHYLDYLSSIVNDGEFDIILIVLAMNQEKFE